MARGYPIALAFPGTTPVKLGKQVSQQVSLHNLVATAVRQQPFIK